MDQGERCLPYAVAGLPNDMNHMDLMVNSATLGVDMTARLLAEVVRDKFS